MSELLKIILGGLIGGLITVSTALVAAWRESKRLEKGFDLKVKELEKGFDLKIKELEKIAEQQEGAERRREREKIRIQYVDPLQVAAADLGERFRIIQSNLADEKKKGFMDRTFNEVKDKDRDKKEEFALWCNGEGYFALSSIYVTAVYLAHASKIRSELPYIRLEPADDRALLEHLSGVRAALGGVFNIWEVLQDSLGTYMRQGGGGVINYRDFCGRIMDTEESVWFLRLIDFFRDIHLKEHEELEKIISSLDQLVEFLKRYREPEAAAA